MAGTIKRQKSGLTKCIRPAGGHASGGSGCALRTELRLKPLNCATVPVFRVSRMSAAAVAVTASRIKFIQDVGIPAECCPWLRRSPSQPPVT